MRDASGKELAARPELTLIKTCRVPSEDVTNAEGKFSEIAVVAGLVSA